MSESTQVSKKTNRWAIVSILCSSCVFILPIVMIGPIFAIIALFDLRRHPKQRGRILAATALCIGCLVTVGYGIAAYWWNTNARMPMLYGPAEELRAGFRGDFSTFKSGFYGAGASASDSEVSALISNLQLRYGDFVGAEQVQDASSASDYKSLLHPQISYIFDFERKQVPALADFLVIDPSRRKFVGKFKWVIIQDEQLGDLVYPASAEQAIRNDFKNSGQLSNGN